MDGRRSCDNFISAAFSYEEMHQEGTRSLARTGSDLAEIQKELVSFQIYVFQRNCYCVCFFRSLNSDKDVSSVRRSFDIRKKKHCFV
jgi:hypothetical protein